MTKSCGIWSTLLYFSFKKLNDLSSSSFISFSCILHNPEVLFSDFSNFHKFKWGDLISWREPILKNDWIIWSPLLYFSFKSFRDPNSLSFIRFQCILHDSRVLFLDFLNIPKLKRGGPNFLAGNNSAQRLNYLVPILYFNFKSFKDPKSVSFIRF